MVQNFSRGVFPLTLTTRNVNEWGSKVGAFPFKTVDACLLLRLHASPANALDSCHGHERKTSCKKTSLGEVR